MIMNTKNINEVAAKVPANTIRISHFELKLLDKPGKKTTQLAEKVNTILNSSKSK